MPQDHTRMPIYDTKPTPDVATGDGFVVVSEWKPWRYTRTRWSYEPFDALEEAVRYHRKVVAGLVRDHAPKGIFASLEGLPVGGALDVETIETVQGGAIPGLRYGLREYEPNSPENKFLKERALMNAGGGL